MRDKNREKFLTGKLKIDIVKPRKGKKVKVEKKKKK